MNADTNFTRDEARARRALLHVDGYDIALTLGPDSPTFRSVTTVRFSCNTPGADTFIDLIAPSATATLNGVALDPDCFSGSRIALRGLAAENVLVVDAQCSYMNTGEGLHKFVDPADGNMYTYTQFEVADARRVFCCFDQPDLKATYQLTVTAPAEWTVISASPTPTPTPAENGCATWTFEPSPRISTYIMSVIAGPYGQITDSHTNSQGREIPLGVLYRQSVAECVDADNIFALTKQGFDYFENTYDQPYPFAKYDQIFVPEFNAGAMENVGAVTFRDQLLFRSQVTDSLVERRALTILHELAHMWFGNLVTMSWWDDLWLNESFAEWSSTAAMAEATRWSAAWTTFAVMGKTWAYRQDQLPSTHPVVADMVDLEAVDANFDGITYAKGASVLKQLVHYVGREAFDAGLREYFRKHAWGNTTFNDLLVELSAASGRDLSTWTHPWLENAGVTTLSPQFTTEDGKITSFAVKQVAPEAYPALRPHRLVIGFYDIVDGTLQRTHRLETDVDGASTDIPELVGRAQPDLILVNDEDFTYAKIRLDQKSLHTATTHLRDLDNSLTRVLLISCAWDMTRDAELSAPAFIDLVLNMAEAEDNSNTLTTALSAMGVCLQAYVHPDLRDEVSERAAQRLWELANNATPGTDAQLQFIRAFCEHAWTPQHADHLVGLLDGGVSVPGVTLDTDLRWHVVINAARCGRFSADQIDLELERDATLAGQQFAAQARAALPTQAAKEAAFTAIMHNADIANATQIHMMQGFMSARDEALMTPFIDRYFAELLAVFKSRTPHIAAQITSFMYPLKFATPELISTTEQFCTKHSDAPSTLLRILTEQQSSAERSLAVQAVSNGRS